jgi:hypothetical protein
VFRGSRFYLRSTPRSNLSNEAGNAGVISGAWIARYFQLADIQQERLSEMAIAENPWLPGNRS